MTKIQPATTPQKTSATPPAKRMYRGIVTAQAIADVFVRTASEAAANAVIAAGKGQRMKPRFSAWELWQEAIPVETYKASQIAVQETSPQALTTQDLEKVYAQVLHNISVVRRATYSDRKRQAMADAVREFYELLSEAVAAKGGKQT